MPAREECRRSFSECIFSVAVGSVMRRPGFYITPRSRGVTIIETLVAIGVVSFLAALLLPAVQVSRESGRRTQCLNNLRQIGVACNTHVSIRGTFPMSTIGSHGNEAQSISPHVRLLPYLDQSAVYDRIDFSETGNYPPGSMPSSNVNKALLSISIPVLVCPSDQLQPGANSYRANMGVNPNRAFRQSPQDLAAIDMSRRGAFRWWGVVAPADFSDGLARTALFSEKLIGAGLSGGFDPPRDYFFVSTPINFASDAETYCVSPPSVNPPHDPYCGRTWLTSGYGQTWYNHVFGPNSAVPDCGNQVAGGGPGAFSARSLHPTGVNLLFADSHCRFVSEAIDLTVWRGVATRAGGESFDDSSF